MGAIFLYDLLMYYFVCLGANIIPNSSNCSLSTVEGALIITSRPALFFGKAIQSRLLSTPAKIETNQTNPKAIPP